MRDQPEEQGEEHRWNRQFRSIFRDELDKYWGIN
jgi:hypothetical protein